ncbi:MAG: DUF460 domain-containing protein [bacterium]|nr:DUF460 domain-containing protein [bacterium]
MIYYINGGTSARYIIVGIDPGTTVGIAILSLHGELLYIGSMRNARLQELLCTILHYGFPVVLAADVPASPRLLKELEKLLRARLFLPGKRCQVEEKRAVAAVAAKGKRLSPHERDALFAALKAYRHYEAKIRNVEKRLRALGIAPEEEIVAEVIKGKKLVEVLHERKLLRSLGRRNLDESRKNKAQSCSTYNKKSWAKERRVHSLP